MKRYSTRNIMTHKLVIAEMPVKTYSWARRRGYRAPPGNQFLIDVSRLEKYDGKRFAMLKN